MLGGRGDSATRAGEDRLEFPADPLSQAPPQPTGIPVRRIVRGGEPKLSTELSQSGPGGREKRANQQHVVGQWPAGVDAPPTSRTGPARECRQYRLELIVGVMRGRDEAAPEGPSDLQQRILPPQAGDRGEVAVASAIDRFDDALEARVAGVGDDEIRLRRGLGAEAVIHMGNDKPMLGRMLRKCATEPQQWQRVVTATDRKQARFSTAGILRMLLDAPRERGRERRSAGTQQATGNLAGLMHCWSIIDGFHRSNRSY